MGGSGPGAEPPECCFFCCWRDPNSRVAIWLLTLVLGIGLVCAIGLGVNGRPAGAIIDNRNCVSLSKLQMVAWTLLVLSALATAGVCNVFNLFGSPHLKALAIDIPTELLAAMGIAAVSLTATPIILGMKADQQPAPNAVANTAAKLNLAPETIAPTGKVFGRTNAADASWFDLFNGDEVGNAGSPDLSKIQQVLITTLLLGIYASSLWSMFMGQATFGALPQIGEKFIWLLAISHASYLTYKAAPHTANS
jgi:hypothetical protein